MAFTVNPETGLPHWGVFAGIAAVCLTIAFTCFKLGSDTMFPFLYTTLYIAANSLAHIIYFRFIKTGNKDYTFPRKMYLLALLTALFIVCGDVSFLSMYRSGAPISISTPLFSAGSVAVTVLFGIFFLKEEITPQRTAGFICAVFGIILLNI